MSHILCIASPDSRFPYHFSVVGVKAAVGAQPTSNDEKLQAYAAMIACPVGAIRTYKPDPIAKMAHLLFPAQIDPERLPGVMHLGYHSMASFGATPYLIKRSAEAGGSIMIDCPRFSSQLANSIEEECGDISTIILTHKDDVKDHEKWKKRFPNLQRIIHRTDATAETADCEVRNSLLLLCFLVCRGACRREIGF
jgi:ferredoxin